MATWQQLQPQLDAALQSQRYRRLALQDLSDQVVQLPEPGTTGVPALDSALIGLSETPNWQELAIQLGLLTRSPGFNRAYVRRDRHDFDFAIVEAWSGGPLRKDWIRKQEDVVWTIFRGAGAFIVQFRLSDSTRARFQEFVRVVSTTTPPVGTQAEAGEAHTPAEVVAGAESNDAILAARLGGDWNYDLGATWAGQVAAGSGAAPSSPFAAVRGDGNAQASAQQQEGGWARWQPAVIQAVLTIVSLLWDVHNATNATGTFIIAGTDGLSDEARNDLESDVLLKQDLHGLSNRTLMATVGLDCREVAAHGHSSRDSLDVGALSRSLRQYLAWPAR